MPVVPTSSPRIVSPKAERPPGISVKPLAKPPTVDLAKSIKPRFKNSPEYGYGWWLRTIKDKHFFMMRGHLGQYVIVEPNDNLIIVRLGHSKGPIKTVATFTDDISVYINEAYKMLEK